MCLPSESEYLLAKTVIRHWATVGSRDGTVTIEMILLSFAAV
jgi:hypothetical protein